MGISLELLWVVWISSSVQCPIILCYSFYLPSRSIGAPQIYNLSIHCRVLICCTCHVQSGSPSFVYFSFLCFQVSLMSNFCPDTRG